MEEEVTISETNADDQGLKPKTSSLAVWSMVFGMLGPFLFGPMLVLLFYGLSFYQLIIESPHTITFFSYPYIYTKFHVCC